MQQMHFLDANLNNTSKSNMLRDIVVAPPLALSMFWWFWRWWWGGGGWWWWWWRWSSVSHEHPRLCLCCLGRDWREDRGRGDRRRGGGGGGSCMHLPPCTHCITLSCFLRRKGVLWRWCFCMARVWTKSFRISPKVFQQVFPWTVLQQYSCERCIANRSAKHARFSTFPTIESSKSKLSVSGFIRSIYSFPWPSGHAVVATWSTGCCNHPQPSGWAHAVCMPVHCHGPHRRWGWTWPSQWPRSLQGLVAVFSDAIACAGRMVGRLVLIFCWMYIAMVLALAMCEFSTKRSGWLTGRLPRRGAACGSESGGSSRSSHRWTGLRGPRAVVQPNWLTSSCLLRCGVKKFWAAPPFHLYVMAAGCGAAKLAVCTAAAEARQWWLPCFTGLVI